MAEPLGLGDLCIVSWWDHTATTNTWMSLEAFVKMATPVVAVSIGKVVKIEKDYIVLISTWGIDEADDLVSNDSVILKSCIEDIKILKRGNNGKTSGRRNK